MYVQQAASRPNAPVQSMTSAAQGGFPGTSQLAPSGQLISRSSLGQIAKAPVIVQQQAASSVMTVAQSAASGQTTGPASTLALQPFALQPSGDTIVVSACGRTVDIQAEACKKLPTLQEALQIELCMQNQAFEIFDVTGTNLQTDTDLVEAIHGGRTPICASLSDASIHYIENRREELSQMQWKLVRDQMSGVAEKIMQLGRRVGELNEAVDRHKKEFESAHDRMQHETIGLVENAKDISRQGLNQMVERVEAMSHLLHSERNIREASKLGLERQIQAVRDVVESDRSARRTEAAATVSLIEDGRQALMEECRARESFEERYAAEMDHQNDRVEALTRSNNEKMQDISGQLRSVSAECNKALSENSRLVLQVRAGAEAAQIEAGSRLLSLEDRVQALEQRIMEDKTGQSGAIDRMNEKYEKVVQSIEQLRLSDRGKGPLIESVLGRVDDLEESFKASENETRDAVLRERLQRQQELRGTQQTLLAQQSKLHSEMHDKVSSRLEQESNLRTSMCQQIMDDVSSVQNPVRLGSQPALTVNRVPARGGTSPQQQGSSLTTTMAVAPAPSPTQQAVASSRTSPIASANMPGRTSPIAAASIPGRAGPTRLQSASALTPTTYQASPVVAKQLLSYR